MAKRRTYEEKLLDQLNSIPPNKFFGIRLKIYDKIDKTKWCWEPSEETEKRSMAIKSLIDSAEQFEFSECYTKIKRLSDERMPELYHKLKVLPAGVTVETISPGYQEWIEHKGKQIQVEHEKTTYRIFNNGRLIAIEFVK
jgi:hypothetical protein